MGAPFIIAGILLIFALRWRLFNIMSLNEDEASSLGMNIQIMRLVFIAASSMITASCVSMCGQVGWVGLLIPHIARMIRGNNNRSVIPMSIGLGAFFMIIDGYLCPGGYGCGNPHFHSDSHCGSTGIYHTFKKNRRCLVMIFRVENGCFGYKEKQISEKNQLYRRGWRGAFRSGLQRCWKDHPPEMHDGTSEMEQWSFLCR